jgi:hypothetical protein
VDVAGEDRDIRNLLAGEQVEHTIPADVEIGRQLRQPNGEAGARRPHVGTGIFECNQEAQRFVRSGRATA